MRLIALFLALSLAVALVVAQEDKPKADAAASGDVKPEDKQWEQELQRLMRERLSGGSSQEKPKEKRAALEEKESADTSATTGAKSKMKEKPIASKQLGGIQDDESKASKSKVKSSKSRLPFIHEKSGASSSRQNIEEDSDVEETHFIYPGFGLGTFGLGFPGFGLGTFGLGFPGFGLGFGTGFGLGFPGFGLGFGTMGLGIPGVGLGGLWF